MIKLSGNLRRMLDSHEMMVFVFTVLIVCGLAYWIAVYLPALIVAILLAYLLDGLIERLGNLGAPRVFAISSTLVLSLLSLIVLLLFGIPRMAAQITKFSTQLPENLPRFQEWIDGMLGDLPFGKDLDSTSLIEPAQTWLAGLGETAVTNTFSNVATLFNLVIYIVLIPLLLFFTLRDKENILNWLGKFIPKSRMLSQLRVALDEQFGAYVRGKIIEGSIIFTLSLISFLLLDVKYALALSAAIGLSVIIPFVGAVAVTVPVVAAGLVQFGFSSEFWWLIGIYMAIQVLDGQLLVPLLFSEVVKIHPVAILVAILFFGAVWGVWGVFFAIPLASLIKSVIAVLEARMAEEPA